MRDLDFRAELVTTRFSRRNQYNVYNNVYLSLGIPVYEEDEEIPFIMSGWNFNGHWNSYRSPHNGELMYTEDMQFNNRTITYGRMEEILNYCFFPIRIHYDTKQYLVGKGFLAFIEGREIIPLYIATAPRDVASIHQVTFHLSRELYKPAHQKVKKMVDSFVKDHLGDIIISADILKGIGKKLVLPKFKNLKERKQYISEMVEFCIDEVKKNVPDTLNTSDTPAWEHITTWSVLFEGEQIIPVPSADSAIREYTIHTGREGMRQFEEAIQREAERMGIYPQPEDDTQRETDRLIIQQQNAQRSPNAPSMEELFNQMAAQSNVTLERNEGIDRREVFNAAT